MAAEFNVSEEAGIDQDLSVVDAHQHFWQLGHGPDRCMFASNYPVDSLVGSFDDIFACFLMAISDRPLAEQRMLVHDNAKRIYRLDGRARHAALEDR